MANICEHCGQTIKQVKLKAVEHVNVEDMTDAQLFAHRKATAPYEDLLFWIAKMPAQLAVRFALLEPLARQASKRREFYRQFTALQDVWRRETRFSHCIEQTEAAESEAVA